jgi:transposase-like protein
VEFTQILKESHLKKWTMPVRDWGLAYSQLAIFFEDRFAA